MMTVQVQHHRKLNNRGASLIELLIVIAILAVMMGGTVVAFSMLNSGNIKDAARTTKSTFEKTRTSAMSVVADEWTFVVENVDGSLKTYANKVYTNEESEVVTEQKEENILGSKVKATLIADSSEVPLNAGDKLKIVFDSSSGSVTSVKVNDTAYSPSTATISIRYSVGNKKNDVKVFFVSGKAEIE